MLKIKTHNKLGHKEFCVELRGKKNKQSKLIYIISMGCHVKVTVVAESISDSGINLHILTQNNLS